MEGIHNRTGVMEVIKAVIDVWNIHKHNRCEM